MISKLSLKRVKFILNILLICFLLICGFGIYQVSSDIETPIFLYFISSILIISLFILGNFYKRKVYENGIKIGFKKRFHLRIHIGIILLAGVGLIILNFSNYNNAGELDVWNLLSGCVFILYALTNLNVYYITITDKHIVKDEITYWKIDKVKSVKFEDKRLVLEEDRLIRYINLIGLGQTTKNELIENIKKIEKTIKN